MQRLEATILKNLTYNEAYMRKVLPFLKSEYFKEMSERTVYTEIAKFIDKYKNIPTHEALIINLTESHELKEDQIRDAVELLNQIHLDRAVPTDIPWLTEQTEKFCQESALYNAVLEAVQIMDDKSGKTERGAIPDLLTKALAVSFDSHVGHDYLTEADSRFAFYHHKEKKIASDLDFLNKITGGGFSVKTLNIFLAGTGVGKTLLMCHLSAAAMSLGYNVLYITMEMAEERIAERIDANLLNVAINDLEKMAKSDYDKKFASLRSKTQGKLIIKEYPTASASTLHFRALLNELQLKKSFRPDIIFIDYLNICASSRIRQGGNVNSYTYIKAIAEELRGLAVEACVPIVSATQTTRSGFDSSDLELTDTSESFGLPATADFMAAIITNEELEKLGQFMIKQLKNRYQDKSNNKRFVVGVDKPKMRLYDADPAAQSNISDSGQVSSQEDPAPIRKPFERVERPKNFKGFKV
jgi:replicative DNA helicase